MKTGTKYVLREWGGLRSLNSGKVAVFSKLVVRYTVALNNALNSQLSHEHTPNIHIISIVCLIYCGTMKILLVNVLPYRTVNRQKSSNSPIPKLIVLIDEYDHIYKKSLAFYHENN